MFRTSKQTGHKFLAEVKSPFALNHCCIWTKDVSITMYSRQSVGSNVHPSDSSKPRISALADVRSFRTQSKSRKDQEN
jgi:hypothetical protein